MAIILDPFYARSQNFEMRLLVSHVRLSVRMERSTHTEGILKKFDILIFFYSLSRNFTFD